VRTEAPRFARALALAALALGAPIGCAASPATEVVLPRPYPDRTTPEHCWETYLWAWRTGDVAALEQTYGLWMRHELLRQIDAQGRTKVSEWYRKDADAIVIEDARWDKSDEVLAYLTVRLGRHGEVPTEVRFAFLRRDDGWCVSALKTLR
jgi:hypothetical protein